MESWGILHDDNIDYSSMGFCINGKMYIQYLQCMNGQYTYRSCRRESELSTEEARRTGVQEWQ
jgi:hypothetical protein